MTKGHVPATPPGLIDTPILLAYREGEPDAVQFITDIRTAGRPILSEFSALALLAWGYDVSSFDGVRSFLGAARVLPLQARVTLRAHRILDQLPPPAGLTADDAIIAATASAHKLPLYTLDPAKFAAVPGLSATRPY